MDKNNYVCNHENDECKIILVARPHYRSILLANEDVKGNLYREKVSIKQLQEQHDQMIQVLEKNNVKVHDVTCFLSDRFERCDLSNLIFTRDPILCTSRGIIVGCFKENVRRLETQIMKDVLEQLNVPIIGQVKYPGFVEGGDFIPAGDRVFIAMGNRTNKEGIEQMLDNDWFGTDAVAILKYPEDGDMKAIHLDCYLGVVGKKHIVVWEHALRVVKVTEMRRVDGEYEVRRKGVGLAEYLSECGYEMIVVDDDSQERYGCNLLDIGNGCVLTQDEYVTQELLARGYRTIFLPFFEVHKMYGGIRCATQTIKRV